MPRLTENDKGQVFVKVMKCPYCPKGIGHFTHLEKKFNSDDDIEEQGVPVYYYSPEYQCHTCGRRWEESSSEELLCH